MNLEKIELAQKLLVTYELDGWLLYDYHKTNSLAVEFLELPKEAFLTRRWFYWIPSVGEPILALHKVESSSLNSLPGLLVTYGSWQEFEDTLRSTLENSERIAMEYSPRNAIPSLSKVDAGTFDMIRSLGLEIISSAPLLQNFTKTWDDQIFSLHKDAASALSTIADATWNHIKNALQENKKISEYEIQQFILKQYSVHDCISNSPPICAVNAHSADPHYMPDMHDSKHICKGDLILIDLWCKKREPLNSVYADITRVAVASETPSLKQQEIFSIVRAAQQAATEFVQKKFANHEPVCGYEIDRVCRKVIVEAGYGDFFIHRTGHNIDIEAHGPGTNIDDYETHDDRLILPGCCFSIEPGIYLPGEFGVRLEYDLVVHSNGSVEVTGGEQNKIVCLC